MRITGFVEVSNRVLPSLNINSKTKGKTLIAKYCGLVI